jgi:hypothetical protein
MNDAPTLLQKKIGRIFIFSPGLPAMAEADDDRSSYKQK